MSQPVLDQAFRVTETNGVARYRAVTAGIEKGTCHYPDADARILGVTTHAQSRADKSVGVRRLGLILCEASDAIPSGAAIIANTDGTINAAPSANGSNGSAGTNNLLVITSKLSGILGNAFSVSISKSEDGDPSSFIISGSTITLLAATDGGGSLVASVNDAVSFINDDAVLSTLISAENGSGSSGAGLVALGTIALSGGEASINAFGIAQEAATASGDLIEIFIH